MFLYVTEVTNLYIINQYASRRKETQEGSSIYMILRENATNKRYLHMEEDHLKNKLSNTKMINVF